MIFERVISLFWRGKTDATLVTAKDCINHKQGRIDSWHGECQIGESSKPNGKGMNMKELFFIASCVVGLSLTVGTASAQSSVKCGNFRARCSRS
jgi:hypothetical protein